LSKMRNYYVGAYAYMRRILEKMVVYFTEKLKTIDDKYVIPSEAEQKIKDVKHYFKPEIQEIIYPFYQVLSKGIHELSDDECEEHYESIHALMLKQLEYMLSIEVDKKQNKELNGVFKKLVEKYGKNK